MASSAFLSPSAQLIVSYPKSAVTRQETQTLLPPHSSVAFRQSSRISASHATTAAVTHSSMYDILGINTGATFQEIKAAYRRLARVVHPDAASSNGQADSSADEFIKIHAAYATLSDPRKRADYDRTLFRIQRRPASTTVRAPTRFSGYEGRRWETDQCW